MGQSSPAPMPLGSVPPIRQGLDVLRRSGTVTELLFLYDCATLEPTQLQPIADRLGLTVQAISHSFRQLKRRQLVEVRDGRYRPTVEGVAWLHATMRSVGDDLFARSERLHIIRSCRAIALANLAPGTAVSLEMRDGLLSARPGRQGSSRGKVPRGGAAGSLVEVTDLEGIIELSTGRVTVRTLSDSDLDDPHLTERLREALGSADGIVLAEGLEPFHAVRSATDRPVIRFAVAAAVREASNVGVPSVVVVMDRDLARWIAEFYGGSPPPLDIRPLDRRAIGPARARPRRVTRETG
jgi:putative transcriptional regulator